MMRRVPPGQSTRNLDILLTLAICALFGWATWHGLRYDSFNDDATYTNTMTDRVLPFVAAAGLVLVGSSLFTKSFSVTIGLRLGGVALILPLVFNFALMDLQSSSSFADKTLHCVGTPETALVLVYLCISFVTQWKLKNRAA